MVSGSDTFLEEVDSILGGRGEVTVTVQQNGRNNRIYRLIRNANFKQQTSLEELETSDARGISAGAITQLSNG